MSFETIYRARSSGISSGSDSDGVDSPPTLPSPFRHSMKSSTTIRG